jgi:hypothetical protein
MAQAETNQVALRAIEEVTWGTTPATPTMPELRWTGGSLVHNKDTVLSDTLRSDRMVDDIAEVMAHAEGDVNMELSFGLDGSSLPVEQGLLMEGALGDDIVSDGETDVTSIEITASTGAVVGVGTDWSTVLPGEWILFDGFSLGTGRGNNGPHKIATVTDGQNLTLADISFLANETASTTPDWATNSIRNGIVKKSYSMEMEFDDVNEFVSFLGMRVNRMEINVTAGQIATISYSFMGQQGVSAGATIATSSPNPPTYSVLNATSNVATLYEGGSALASAIRSVSVTVDNAGRNLPAVANAYAIGINYGRQSITGTIEAYFEDETLLEKYIDHTETSIDIPLYDLAGNWTIISIPSMYFSEGSPNVPGIDDEVMQTLNFAARREPTNQLYQIQVCYLPAF